MSADTVRLHLVAGSSLQSGRSGRWPLPPPSQASTAPVTNRPVLEAVADGGGSAWFGIVLLLPGG